MGKGKRIGATLPLERIQQSILLLRAHKVMLDFDLAALYGVQTKILNKAVKRNLQRFPADFMFELSDAEFENLRFQFGTSRWGGRRYRPYAFSEQGVAMLSSVLRSERAVLVNMRHHERTKHHFNRFAPYGAQVKGWKGAMDLP
ncbi:MAG TPA: ORF6N domain-containing protein [Burkholderiales bacterium]|nr:ORF6N domain-containing protein [Burkholderiales bacterium]